MSSAQPHVITPPVLIESVPASSGSGEVILLKRGKPLRREVAETVSETITITEQMVKVYAALVNDENPIHVDKDSGRASIFGTTIAHGMLIGSLFGPLVVNQLIGPGAIYRKQTLEFEAPVPVGEAVTAKLTVTEAKHKDDKDIYVIQTECFLPDGKRVINGEAVIIAPHAGLQAPPAASAS
jgi:acyl dehydratase